MLLRDILPLHDHQVPRCKAVQPTSAPRLSSSVTTASGYRDLCSRAAAPRRPCVRSEQPATAASGLVCPSSRARCPSRAAAPRRPRALSQQPTTAAARSEQPETAVSGHLHPSLPCPICGFKSLRSVGTFSLLLLFLCLASRLEATDQRLCLRKAPYCCCKFDGSTEPTAHCHVASWRQLT